MKRACSNCYSSARITAVYIREAILPAAEFKLVFPRNDACRPIGTRMGKVLQKRSAFLRFDFAGHRCGLSGPFHAVEVLHPADSGKKSASFQALLHMAVTAAVVTLSIVSPGCTILAGSKGDRELGCHCPPQDAGRCALPGQGASPVFRHCGTFQRIFGFGAQRGTGGLSVQEGCRSG